MRNIRKKLFSAALMFVFYMAGLNDSCAFTLPLPKVLPGESQEIPVAGSTVRIKGITDQANTLTINGRDALIRKDGSFEEEVIIPLGDTEIVIIARDKDGREKSRVKKIKAKETHFFLVGLADGTLNYSKSDPSVRWERDSKHFREGFNVDGKISYYLAGKILGKFLIKSSLDTDKSTQEKLFTYIDPDKYYPIYGDNSTVVYDVNSQGKFYALFEWDSSGLVVGNYQTQIADDGAQLAAYNRTLYGGKIHLESTQRTVYGDPLTKADLFAAEANQHAGHSEFLATGGSLYYLRHVNIVEGSEQVRLDVRDKNSGMTIYSAAKAPMQDYEIKYDEGRITFREPALSVAASDTIISSSALNGNPVYIVVNYEYKDQDAFPATIEQFGQRTGGLRIQQSVCDNLKAGVTYVQEQKDDGANDYRGPYRLYGVDGVFRLGNFTKAQFEYAETRSSTIPLYVSYNGGYDFTAVNVSNGAQDKAIRLNANANIGEYFGCGREFLDLSGYWQYIGPDFITQDKLFEAGTEKYGFEASHRFSANDKVRFIYENKMLLSDNPVARTEVTAKRVNDFIAQWAHRHDRWTFVTEGMFRGKENSYSHASAGQHMVREDSLAERIQYELSKDASVFIGEQLTQKGSLVYRTSAGFTANVSKDLKAAVEGAVGKEGNSLMASFNRTVDGSNTAYMNYTFAESALDGRSSTTSFGSNTAINDSASLRTERQFVTSDVRGRYAADVMGVNYEFSPQLGLEATYQRRADEVDYDLMKAAPRDTVSASLRWVVPDRCKAYSKGEYRNDSDKTWQVLTDNSAEVKLSSDIFLFGEYEYSIGYREQANDSYSRIDKKQVGLAYRPVRFDWFNLLFKYIRFTDERPDAVTSADGGFLKMHSTSDTWAAECALDLPFSFQFVEKFAYKYEKSLSYDTLGFTKTPDDLKAILMVHRLNYHLTRKWDAAFEYRILQQKGPNMQDREDGFLIEANYLIMKNIAVGAGFNFTSFADNLDLKLSEFKDKNARGFFLRLQGRY